MTDDQAETDRCGIAAGHLIANVLNSKIAAEAAANVY
jgi:hypothetical protein